MTALAHTATQIVVQCENMLGWTPSDKVPLYKARALEARKLNAQMEKDPEKVTFDNLELAIEWSRKKRLPVKAPVALIYRIDKALEDVAVIEQHEDIARLIDDAVTKELTDKAFGYDAWVEKLYRARGAGRHTIYARWREARGG